MDAYSVREKQGLVPDLQIDGPHYELKGIRVDGSNANYNGGLRSTPRAHGAREGRVRGFLGGALRCLADSGSPSQKK
jgi:hypothetical protein